jgi:hypothetical protein
LQQRECTHDIGLDELTRPIDRTIDVTFRSQIHNRIRLITLKERSQSRSAADVHFCERVPLMSSSLRSRGQVCSIRQLVDVDDIGLGPIKQMPHDC